MLSWVQIAPVYPGKPQIWDGLRDFEVDPISRVVVIGVGTHNSLGEGKHSRQFSLQGPEPVGCICQGCLDS